MSKWIFENRNREPSKIETWGKFELFELFNDLDEAEKILTDLIGTDSENLEKVKEFHKEFIDELNDLKYQNVPDFGRICFWFLPSSTWDDIVGANRMDLANRIYERANNWNRANL